MFKLAFLALFLTATTKLASSLYDFSLPSIDGGTIHFSDFGGKKVLLVNIATESTLSPQIMALEQLQQTYRDSLVVVAIPSNSFGYESGTNEQIRQKLRGQYGVTFLVTEKMEVTGDGASPLYQWLSAGNGRFKVDVLGDFHKFLINRHGELMGYFVPGVDPVAPHLQRAIQMVTR